MADERAPFPTLEDVSTLDGKVLAARQQGDTGTGVNGSIGFAFKDSAGNVILVPIAVEGDAPVAGPVGFAFKDFSGNLVLPQLDATGRLPVNTGAMGTPVRAHASVAGSLSVVTVAAISLVASTKYSQCMANVACRRGALFQLIWNNNGTDTILSEAIVDAGQYTFSLEPDNMEITSGATGAQELKVKAFNFDKASDLKATITALQS